MMTVTLPGPSSVVFQEQEINALRVTVTDPEGTMAKAGMATGDLVVAINGKEFSSVVELQIVMAGAVSKKTMVMTVLRGRKRFDVEVDPRKMLGGRQMGGSFEPTSR
jgi:S1-C subfamily serine protease